MSASKNKLPLNTVRFYFDYKSPFSYLAKFKIFDLEKTHPNIKVEYLPFQFSVKKLFGNPDMRDPLQWNKVRYGYMDVRRFANEHNPPLKIMGPTKAYDSTVALIGGLYCLHRRKDNNKTFRIYTDRVFELFFNRKFDVESVSAVKDMLADVSADKEWASKFDDFLAEGRKEIERIEKQGIEEDKIWGVPSFIYNGELFFGADRFDWLIKAIDSKTAKL